MNDDTDIWIPVATVIPKYLHRAMRTHCRTNAVTLMEFVAQALVEKLGETPRLRLVSPRRVRR